MLPPHDSLSVGRPQLVRGMVPGGIFLEAQEVQPPTYLEVLDLPARFQKTSHRPIKEVMVKSRGA